VTCGGREREQEYEASSHAAQGNQLTLYARVCGNHEDIEMTARRRGEDYLLRTAYDAGTLPTRMHMSQADCVQRSLRRELST
jgi:hypothetical protein